jgi:hypothetical protein
MSGLLADYLLITTKLHRPAVDGQWVPRPRLLARLNGGLRKRLTLISAPAGFGKTTLADLILVDGNPLENLDLVADPGKNFVLIMKDGKIYKNTL